MTMNYFGSNLYLDKSYAVGFAIYIIGWILASVGLIKTARYREGFLFLGYTHQNLKIIGVCLLWPFSLVVFPLGVVGFFLWMFVRPAKR